MERPLAHRGLTPSGVVRAFALGPALLACALLTSCASAHPSVKPVRSGLGLKWALWTAQGGDTILLAPGRYGDIVIRRLHKGRTVVMASADKDVMATASSISIDESSDIVIRRLAVEMDGRTGVSIGASSRVRLEGLRVKGRSAGGSVGSGNGAAVKRSDDVVITGSEFSTLGHGISFRDVRKLTVEQNYIHNIRADGIHGSGAVDLTIRNNFFRDFYRQPKDHPDAIQIWTKNATGPAQNILVAENLIVRGDGRRMQGIFITDQSHGKLPYEKVVIRGNVVVGSMYHGITLSSAVAPVIEGNLVVGFNDGPGEPWIALDRSTNAIVRNNSATAYRMKRENENLQRIDNTSIATLPAVGDLTIARQWYATRKDVISRMPPAARSLIQ